MQRVNELWHEHTDGILIARRIASRILLSPLVCFAKLRLPHSCSEILPIDSYLFTIAFIYLQIIPTIWKLKFYTVWLRGLLFVPSVQRIFLRINMIDRN